VFGLLLLSRNGIVIRQTILGGAGLLTLFAPDANGGVVEQRFAHENRSSLLATAFTRDVSEKSLCRRLGDGRELTGISN
jgi:hypothetical protein